MSSSERRKPCRIPEASRCQALLRDSWLRPTNDRCRAHAHYKIGDRLVCAKHGSALALQIMLNEGEAQELAIAQPTLRETWATLIRFDGIGSFLAGQVVADLAHLPDGCTWPDRDTWAPLGPGSARGINRLRGIPKNWKVCQLDFEVHLQELITVLRPRIADIWDDRKLQAMDVQNCLCEFDKYRRLQLGEGKVRARYDGSGSHAQQLELAAS